MCEQRKIFSHLKKCSYNNSHCWKIKSERSWNFRVSTTVTGTFCDDIKYFWGLFFWLGSKACRQNVPTTGLEFSSLWFFARLELLPAMLHSIKPKKQLGYVGGLNPSSSSFFDEESPRTNRSLTWKDSFSYLAPFISFIPGKMRVKPHQKKSVFLSHFDYLVKELTRFSAWRGTKQALKMGSKFVETQLDFISQELSWRMCVQGLLWATINVNFETCQKHWDQHTYVRRWK